jgi:transposase
VNEQRGYYTDTTDDQWAMIEPVIAAWKARHPSASGHAGRYEMRRIMDALLYQSRSGCQWSLLPREFPPSSAVKYCFYRWRDEHADEVIHELLRCRVREGVGRSEDPSLVVLDSQSVRGGERPGVNERQRRGKAGAGAQTRDRRGCHRADYYGGGDGRERP